MARKSNRSNIYTSSWYKKLAYDTSPAKYSSKWYSMLSHSKKSEKSKKEKAFGSVSIIQSVFIFASPNVAKTSKRFNILTVRTPELAD